MLFCGNFTHIAFFNVFRKCIYVSFLIDMPIPMAIILLEGDLDSIKYVKEATKKGIPVIIIKGSGKAADIILDYLERFD